MDSAQQRHQQAFEEKNREFRQYKNDAVPDKRLTRREQEQVREALHTHLEKTKPRG